MRSLMLRTIAVAAVVLTGACSTSDSVAPAPAIAASARTTAARAASAAVTGDVASDGTTLTDATAFASGSRSIEGYQWISCAANGAGEYVRTSGDIRYWAHRLKDSSGVYHININSNTSQLTGVGTTTGDTYRGMQTERVISRGVGYSGFQSLRIAETIHFVATGGGADFTVQYDTHIEVDENGTLVLWVQDQRVSCN